MRHPTEEELILYYYGEHATGAEVETHLAGCVSCRGEYEAIVAVLAVVEAEPIPERGEEYVRQVWERLEARMGSRRKKWWPAIGAVAAMVVFAFLASRVGPRLEGPAPEPDRWEQARERILLADVGEHLERAEVVLTEAANDGGEWRAGLAEDLIEANRLYRQAASGSGERAVAAMLEDLERVLLEMSHGAGAVKGVELEDMVFKVRATAMQVRVRGLEASREHGHS